ncbi:MULTISPECIES: hypothetical protein [Olivibacter]|uniref:Carboxypeptidase-like protein n=1 Tax=Olivibacter oleidegradans TaxID=760123 RepID=A0ABV6HPW3_9SPHI|nr:MULTISPECIES: hypothetical protein [Olivibacter]QEL03639.1 hypothetical protein FKG96_23320 [Olivibacter sp. LS-1]
MIKPFILFSLLLASVITVSAQDRFRGIVLEYKSNELMPEVSVKNLNKHDSTRSNRSGEFSLRADKDDILVFSYPGYRTDSLVVTDFALKRVYLTSVNDPRMLDEVNINALTNSRIAEEKERLRKEGQFANTVSGGSSANGTQRMGGIGFSPSRIFGKGARNARRQYRMLEVESNNRIIDARFTEELITSLTPLRGEDLSLFMAKYRPKASFIQEANDETLRLYIMDSYNKYKDLSSAAKEKIKLDNKEPEKRAK